MYTYSNSTKLLFSQGQAMDSISPSSKSSQETSNNDFQAVLSKSLSNATRTVSDNKANSNDKVNQNSDSKIKYHSFREFQRANAVSKNPTEKTNSKDMPAEIESGVEKLQDSSDQTDASINVLAMMLGLQPGELLKMAKELGFTAEDLKNIKNLTLFTDKLADKMGLNESQKSMLTSLVAEISEQLKPDASAVTTLSNTNIASEDKTNTENSANSAKTIDFTAAAEKVKGKLDQLIQKTASNTESVGLEISKVIEAMKSQQQGKTPVIKEQTDLDSTKHATDGETAVLNADQKSSDQITAQQGKDAKNSDDSTDKKKQADSETSDSVGSGKKSESRVVTLQTNAANTQNNQMNEQNTQVIGDVNLKIINNQVEVEKPVFSVPQQVKSTELLNQVVEQAKVLIGQDKSEMVIQLKPDHLGKLELKVVTEQGIVAAKFVAENQKVKEIIETNMQMLKDSLQKQGISVDSVNVQVGHDKNGEFGNQNTFQNTSNNSKGSKYKFGNQEGISKVSTTGFETLPERLAQYTFESNTINLTA